MMLAGMNRDTMTTGGMMTGNVLANIVRTTYRNSQYSLVFDNTSLTS